MSELSEKREKLSKQLRGSNFRKSTTTSSKKQDPEQLIANYQARLASVGLTPEDLIETQRHPLEKLLGLDRDNNQGFIMDTLELLDKPVQTLAGAAHEAVNGKNALEGAWKGLSGQETYHWGDIYRDAGLPDTNLGFNNPLNGEKVRASDIVGTVGDIALDPTLYIPVAGGVKKLGDTAKTSIKVASTAKAASKATKLVEETTKAAELAKKSKDLYEIARTTNEANRAKRLASEADKAHKAAVEAQKAVKTNKYKTTSLLDTSVKGLASGAKGIVKLTDKAIKKGLDIADTKNMRDVAKAVAKNRGDVNQIYRAENQLGDIYEGVKKSFARTADYAKSSGNPELVNSIKQVDNAAESVLGLSSKELDELTKKEIENYVKRADAPVKSAEEFGRAAENVLKSKGNYANYDMTNGLKALTRYNNSGTAIEGTKESLTKFAKELNNIESVKANNLITGVVKDDVTGLYRLQMNEQAKGFKRAMNQLLSNESTRKVLANTSFKRNVSLSSAQKATMKRHINAYNTNPEFKKLIDRANNITPTASKNVENATGIKQTEIANSSDIYGRKAVTQASKQLSKGSDSVKKAFGTADYQEMTAEEANNVIRAKQKEALNKAKKKKESLERKRDIKETINENGKVTTREIKGLEEAVITKEGRLQAKKQTLELVKSIEQNQPDLKALKVMKENASKADKKLINARMKSIKSINDKQVYDRILDNLSENYSRQFESKLAGIMDSKHNVNYLRDFNDYEKAVNNYIKERKALETLGTGTNEAKIMAQNEKLAKAYQNMIKAEDKMTAQRAIVQGAITKDEVKRIEKAKKTIQNATLKSKDALQMAQRNADNYKNMVNQLEGNIKELERQKLNLITKIETLDPLKKSNINAFKDIEHEIARTQSDIDMYGQLVKNDWFETDSMLGTRDYLKTTERTAKAINHYNQVLLKAGLNDEKFAKFTYGDEITKVPSGSIKLSPKQFDNFINTLKEYKNLLPEGSKDMLDDLIDSSKNANGLIIDRTAYEMIEMGIKNVDEGANAIIDVTNKATTLFKKNSTLSLGFQIRNVIGNTCNMWLSGIPGHKMAAEYTKALKYTAKPDTMYNILEKGISNADKLTSTEKEEFELIRDFVYSGFYGQGAAVRDLKNAMQNVTDMEKASSGLKKAYNAVFKANMYGNEVVDMTNRLAIFSYARKNPKYLDKLGVKTPADAVRFTAFDPSNMSPFENNVMKKIIPFYTFTKQNLMFQARNIVRNPKKYGELLRAIGLSYETVGENNLKDYQKENFQIPIYTDKNGNTVAIKANLPVADFLQWMSDPAGELVNASSPYLKNIYEGGTGIDPFTKRETTKTTKDYLFNALGLNNLSKIPERVSNIYNADEDDTTAYKTSNALGSILGYTEQGQVATGKTYDDLAQYQAYLKSLKDQGIEIPTLTELKKQGYDTDAIREEIRQANKRLAELKKNRGNQ